MFVLIPEEFVLLPALLVELLEEFVLIPEEFVLMPALLVEILAEFALIRAL